MKWNILKTYIAIICISTQIFTPFQADDIQRKAQQLSPVSPFASQQQSPSQKKKIEELPSIADLKEIPPLPEPNKKNKHKLNFKGTNALGLNYDVTQLNNGDGYKVTLKWKHQTKGEEHFAERLGDNLFRFKTEETQEVVKLKQSKNGETKKTIVSQKKLTRKIITNPGFAQPTSPAFDSYSENRITLKEVGDFSIYDEPIDYDLTSNYIFHRAWWNQINQYVILAQPAYSNEGTLQHTTESYFIVKDSDEADEEGNKIFQGVDYTTGKNLSLLEKGDFLIEKDLPSEPGFYTKVGWNKRENKGLAAFVAEIEGKTKRFLFVKMLGSGSEGIVFKAWDMETNQFVIIKLFIFYTAPHKQNTEKKYYVVQELQDSNQCVVWDSVEEKFAVVETSSLKRSIKEAQTEKNKTRFNTESNMVKSMNHPNVVKGLANGTTPSPFYIMEYNEGKTLSDLIRGRNLTVAQSTELLKIPLKALNYLQNDFALEGKNKLTILHLDIKPQNIFIQSEKEGYLFDFGVARALSRTGIDEPIKDFRGSPSYMSPEQTNPFRLRNKEDRANKIMQVIQDKTLTSKIKTIQEMLQEESDESKFEIIKRVLKKDSENILRRRIQKNPKNSFDLKRLIHKILKEETNNTKRLELIEKTLKKTKTTDTAKIEALQKILGKAKHENKIEIITDLIKEPKLGPAFRQLIINNLDEQTCQELNKLINEAQLRSTNTQDRINQTADIYAVGILFYYLLFNRTPFLSDMRAFEQKKSPEIHSEFLPNNFIKTPLREIKNLATLKSDLMSLRLEILNEKIELQKEENDLTTLDLKALKETAKVIQEIEREAALLENKLTPQTKQEITDFEQKKKEINSLIATKENKSKRINALPEEVEEIEEIQDFEDFEEIEEIEEIQDFEEFEGIEETSATMDVNFDETVPLLQKAKQLEAKEKKRQELQAKIDNLEILEQKVEKFAQLDERALIQIQNIILKATAFDPAQRYQNANAMLQDLQSLENVLSSNGNSKHVEADVIDLFSSNFFSHDTNKNEEEDALSETLFLEEIEEITAVELLPEIENIFYVNWKNSEVQEAYFNFEEMLKELSTRRGFNITPPPSETVETSL